MEDRAPEIHPTGIPVDLIGESCIPGIIVDDIDGIFEEHSIRKEIDPYYTHGTQYGTTDKVLYEHKIAVFDYMNLQVSRTWLCETWT